MAQQTADHGTECSTHHHAGPARDRDIGDIAAWGLKAWDFDDFHRNELPRRLGSGVNEQVVWDLEGAPPFTVALEDGRAYSYVIEDGAVRVEPGRHADARCAIVLRERAWQNYVHEFRTPASLVLAQAVHFARGGMAEWDVWAPAIQCMYSGRPIYNPAEVLRDRRGAPLDLQQTFTLADDHTEMTHFLKTAGFLVVKGAMTHRLAEIRAEIVRLRDAAQEGTIFSWWTDNLTTHEHFPYRMMFISEYSDLVRSLMDDDPTVAELVALSGRDLIPLHDRGQGAMTVLKPFGQGEELAPSVAGNLGWHTDCGLGGCNIMCPSINIGIQLEPANAQGSRLWVMAGTTGKSIHHAGRIDETTPNTLPLTADPGDVVIHYSCTLHAGPPPTGPNPRMTLYLPFYGRDTLKLLGRFQAFEQILPGYGSGDIPSLFDVAKDLGAKSYGYEDTSKLFGHEEA